MRPFHHAALAVVLASSACSLAAPAPDGERTIRAEVVALDQPIVYNRFGSFNPYGHIYALKRDVVTTDGRRFINDSQSYCPGEVRLRDLKRPRPLVLRGNVGDVLEIEFENLLTPGPDDRPEPGNLDLSRCSWTADEHYARSYASLGKPHDEKGENALAHPDLNWPATRSASITVVGLTPLAEDADANFDLAHTGIAGIPPGATRTYRYRLHRPGSFFFYSNAAPAGGEGEGGSLTHGLFGVIQVELAGSRWFRSQVTKEEWAEVAPAGGWPDGSMVDYFKTAAADVPALGLRQGDPLLAMLRRADGEAGSCDAVPGEAVSCELIHSDINAIVHECPIDLPKGSKRDPSCATAVKQAKPAFREFVVAFHDELKTFYADAFQELERPLDAEFNALAGVRDGFAINYGASGLGTMLLANRKGLGPTAKCVECSYEEFFLTSWANGDPALLPQYEDDPSNVHHSYLNDRIEFRNLHAGPKETHVFHLHAHQWLSERNGPGEDELGSYLDSQTIAPLQAFSYPIYYDTSGNRNLTPGDAIFHCHLYPHFAQGMWALWRIHDVLENGSRRLPDGEFATPDGRSGTDPITSEIPLGADGRPTGTPIPAVVPLPQQAMPPLPTYGDQGMPGYPFYIPGKPGHRPPQPPLEMAESGGLPRHLVRGGKRGMADVDAATVASTNPDELVKRALMLADFSTHLEEASLDLLPEDGTPLERRAMAFHAGITDDPASPHDGAPVTVQMADGTTVTPGEVLTDGASFRRKGFASITPEGRKDDAAVFWVNGLPPARGAPYADPCVADDGGAAPERIYKVSAVGVDLVVNAKGWHDPQARINVLSDDIARYVETTSLGDVPRTVGVGREQQAKPFFFRAHSGDCIEFQHTNRTPKDLDLDDFQMRVPTDTIGQHIHLVKFDVTSSDGSGNGFNYEDGTFAPDAVHERLAAANAPGGAVFDGIDGTPRAVPTPAFDEGGRPILTGRYQTTIQRWFADPLIADDPATGKNKEGAFDRTLRTVFTHDHFAPSNIQQHGFYSALLIEPKGSEWALPDGKPMDPDADPENSKAVGTQAIIDVKEDPGSAHVDHREFAMAVADFALLYDPEDDPRAVEEHGLDNQVAVARRNGLDREGLARLAGRLREVRDDHRRPVDPPALPEAISKDHHNPYLVNYAHEPLPLRIAQAEGQGGWRLRDGEAGDLAHVFSSRVHGDPVTEPIEGYAGKTVQLRMVQGAQEVQHMFTIDGLSWRREINRQEDEERLLRVPAQEIGISEHFEMALPALRDPDRDLHFDDYLYRYASIDDLWNGAWGLTRVYLGPDSVDPAGCPPGASPYIATGSGLEGNADCGTIDARLARVGGQDWVGKQPVNTAEFTASDLACPNNAPRRYFRVEAHGVADLNGGGGMVYDAAHNIVDQAGLAYLLVQERKGGVPARDPAAAEESRQAIMAALAAGEPLRPLVLRAEAGDCLEIEVFNFLPEAVPEDQDSDRNPTQDGNHNKGMLPRIVPINAGDLTPSDNISLAHQHASTSQSVHPGIRVGYAEKGSGLIPRHDPSDLFGQTIRLYAGRVQQRSCDVPHKDKPSPCPAGRSWLHAQREALGVVNLVSMGDVVEHGSQGLIGMLVVEEKGAEWRDPASCPEHAQGEVCADWDDLQPFSDPTLDHPAAALDRTAAVLKVPNVEPLIREFAVLYQDGLGLRYPRKDGISAPVPDCRVCDDSYDLGEKGLDYASAPFWARFGLPELGVDALVEGENGVDLNRVVFPPDFFDVAGSFGGISTPHLRAVEGERLRFRIGQSFGRARQRTFVVLGHDYLDAGRDRSGSPATSLISVAKAATAEIERAHPGYWLYRDGPAQHFSGGVWGVLEVTPRGEKSLAGKAD